jgi:hypothetical protein
MGMKYGLDKEKGRILKDFMEDPFPRFAICNMPWLVYYA